MTDEMEMKEVVSDNNNVSSDQTIEEIPGNGTQESSRLLSEIQPAENNIDQHQVDSVHVERGSPPETTKKESKSLIEELNQVVVWKFKLWMMILLVIIAISLVIAISVIMCAEEEDVDEKYDKSMFVVERFFRGNFALNSTSLALNPQNQETLIEHLKQQVNNVYNSSPALERYFSDVTINNVQNSTAQFELKFLMPSENEDLIRFTLSGKMVKNVLVQYFYEQDGNNPLHVIPTSIKMEAF